MVRRGALTAPSARARAPAAGLCARPGSTSLSLSILLSTHPALNHCTRTSPAPPHPQVFRGFLLTSLTKWMSTPAAVLLSSIAFGFVHLAPRDFPQLTSLGVLLGFSYVRSRNLLTPMLIHGAWNGAVLTLLCVLASQGVDIQKLIHEGTF